MNPVPETHDELEARRASVAWSFRPRPAGPPRRLTADEYDEATALLERGGLSGLDTALVTAVRSGAQPGDPLPPEEPIPYIHGVHDTDVRIVGDGDERRVVVLFSHQAFPGQRFGYAYQPPAEADEYEDIWLMEEIDTGALHRIMRYDHPEADESDVTWVRLYGQLLGWVGETDVTRLRLRAFAWVGATVAGETCGIWVSRTDRSTGPCGRPSIARAPRNLWATVVSAADGHPASDDLAFVGACPDHVDELRRRVELRHGEVEGLRS